jgi:hypothetical protein
VYLTHRIPAGPEGIPGVPNGTQASKGVNVKLYQFSLVMAVVRINAFDLNYVL